MPPRHLIVGGAQRSGTSLLWHLLDAHPDIEMSRPLHPEPKYFLDERAWRERPEAYTKRLFGRRPDSLLLGEKSTSYMERPEAAARIRELLPEARIVFVLRDPVERAVSNYWFSVEHGVETVPMEEAFAREEERLDAYDRDRFSVSPFAYVTRGLYDELLRPWEAIFPPAQMKLVLFERLVQGTSELRRLLRFLGVSTAWVPDRAPPPVHPGRRRHEPPARLRRALEERFRRSSSALAERHDLDLSCWASLHALASSNGSRTAGRRRGPQERVPFHRAGIVGRELEHVALAARGGGLGGDGPFAARCERLLREALGSAGVLLTPSCTQALELAALLLGIGPGDEVVVPAFTFVSTANAFVMRGARPVFVDVREDTLGLDESLLEAALGPRTRAVVPVHYAGVGCAMSEIVDLARARGVPIVEDNAHGLFASYRGRPLGTFGALASLSFHETKNFSCGEGGALVINDPEHVERAEILREKGTDRSRFRRGEIGRYTWRDIGSSYLMSELQSAFLFGQLEQRDRIQGRREALWNGYREQLGDWCRETGARPPSVPADRVQSYHLFHLLMPDPGSRARLIAHLAGRGVEATFHYLPLHLSEMGRRFGGELGDHPVCEAVAGRLVRLPLYATLTDDEQARVIEAVLGFDP